MGFFSRLKKAKCVLCGEVEATENFGLCFKCARQRDLDLEQRGRIINDSIRIIDNSKNIETKMKRLDMIDKHAKHLLRYEEKGIPTLNPLPSFLLTDTKRVRKEVEAQDSIEGINL